MVKSSTRLPVTCEQGSPSKKADETKEMMKYLNDLTDADRELLLKSFRDYDSNYCKVRKQKNQSK